MRSVLSLETKVPEKLLSLEQQIWKDQYIGLALLLPQNNTSTNLKGLQFQVVANCTLSVIPNKPRYDSHVFLNTVGQEDRNCNNRVRILV
jgi:hypothetical protein